MSNLAGLPSLGLKEPKAKPDPAYLARVRELPCCICEAFGEPQATPTAAHHVIMGRFSQRKTPDRMAIPLCTFHHTGGHPAYLAIHVSPAAWRERYGPDVDYILPTQDKLGFSNG